MKSLTHILTALLALILFGCDLQSLENETDELEVPKDTFFVVINRIHNNYKCLVTDQNFGELKAFVLTKDSTEVEDYSLYTFQWYSGLDLSTPIANADSSRLMNLEEGNYTLVVTDSTGKTSQVSALINADFELPKITIIKWSDQTDKDNPNGKLEVVIEGSLDWYSIQWEDNFGPLLGMNSPIASGLKFGLYTVVITGPNGCSYQMDAVVLDYT